MHFEFEFQTGDFQVEIPDHVKNDPNAEFICERIR